MAVVKASKKRSGISVDGDPVPANVFVVHLRNKKVVRVSGPASVDVRDGALVICDGTNKGQIAIAPGGWLSVNIDHE